MQAQTLAIESDSAVQVKTVSSLCQGSAENAGGIYGSSGVEGNVDGPRQLLSRSLPGGKNPVSVLMEYCQRSGNAIEFINTGQAGPPHDPRYGLLHLPLNLFF